jgi:transcriptional regulator with XRE-family HTH domain
MTLGEQLKRIRVNKGLSQPELADISGIEQSYLSKLENDKSLPSNDILRKLLGAFNITLEEFLKPLDSSYIQRNLLDIADVEQYFKKVSKGEINQQRNFLYIASALIVVAVTLFYIGYSKQLFNERIYKYQSKGVVLAGEPLNIFTHWKDLIDSSDPVKHIKEIQKQRVVMAQRSDIEIMFTYKSKGDFFDISSEEGTRLFEYAGSGQRPRAINVWLQILGVLFFSSGVMGFVLERKFYKNT